MSLAVVVAVVAEFVAAERGLGYYLLYASGQLVLIHAAAGGVGSVACQWAKSIGGPV